MPPVCALRKDLSGESCSSSPLRYCCLDHETMAELLEHSRTFPIPNDDHHDASPGRTRRSPRTDNDGGTVVDVDNLTKAGVFLEEECAEVMRPQSIYWTQNEIRDTQLLRSRSLAGRRNSSTGRHHFLVDRYTWTVILSALLSLAVSADGFNAWTIRSVGVLTGSCVHRKQPCFMTADNEDSGNEGRTPEDDMFGEDLDTGAVMIDELSWRVEKMRLEEQNRQRFLKARPRFLPYNECRKWVQAFGRWETEEDWRQWISMGEKRNSYIPSRPDEYYGRLGQW